MSWLQGVQPREELPEKFLAWADAQKDGARLEYITWFDDDRSTLILDYGEAGALRAKFKQPMVE